MSLRAAALAAALLLAACTTPGPSSVSPSAVSPGSGALPSARGLSLVPAAQGLAVAPTDQEIGFGRYRPGAVAAATRVLGRAPDSIAAGQGCELTAARWERDGLTMYFAGRDAAFVGWRTGGGRTFSGESRTAGEVCPALSAS